MSKYKDMTKTMQDTFAPLRVSDVIQLTTFRRNGQGVATPVSIQFVGNKTYFTTWTATGKVKRLAQDPRVQLAPFKKVGMKVIGPPIEATARRLTQSEAEAVPFKKSWWGDLWNLIYRLRGWQPVVYELLPVKDDSHA